MTNTVDDGKSHDDQYGKDYYDSHCGAPYDRSVPGWLVCFGRIADHLVKRIAPRTVLDAGCAKGFLVESLRDRGVEAFGVDISRYAISEVREDVRPYCRIGDLMESLPSPRYDLITCIEVLEHLPESSARKTIQNLCAHTNDIVFSSTPSDFREESHFNVRPHEYWIELFSECGFFYDQSFDCSFIAPQAMRFRRRPSQRELRIGVCSMDTLSGSASGRIRLLSPLEEARAQFGLTYTNCFEIESGQPKLRQDLLDQNNVLVIQREAARSELSDQILAYARRRGTPVVYELDELLTELPESNPLDSAWEKLKIDIIALMHEVDLITVPTLALKRHIGNLYPGLVNKIGVLPNCLDLNLWPSAPKSSPKGRDERVSILFSGSPTDAEDLKVIEDALLYVLRRHERKVKCALWGSSSKRLESFVIGSSAFDYQEYARILSRLECDLAVVPLKDNPYNRAKSAIKWLEYSAAGIPSIFSNLGPYSESIKNGFTGVLVSNEPRAWVEALELMILNRQWRNVIAENAYRQVREEFNIKRNAYKWYDLYLALVESHAGNGCRNSRDSISLRYHQGVSKGLNRTVNRPEAVATFVRQADERFARGDLAGARDALGRALAILPDDPELVVTYGNLLLRDGDVEAARREFVKATVLAPDYTPAHSNLAAVLLHLGCANEAEASARQALALNQADTDSLRVLARVCLDGERYSEAVQAYVTILRQTPDDVETLLIVGNCYAEAGRPEDANTFYQRVLQLDPGNAVAAENLAIVNGKEPASDRAVSTDGKASADISSPLSAPTDLVEVSPAPDDTDGSYRQALSAHSCSAQTPPSWPQPVVEIVQEADNHFRMGDLVSARQSLTEALPILPDDLQLILALGNIILRLGDVEGARREFMKATRLHPEHGSAYLNLAAVLLMLERREEAERAVQRALELEPAHPDALKLLGRICLESQRFDEGVRAYAEALRGNPNDMEALLILGRCAVEACDLHTAQRLYERVLALDPANMIAKEHLALVNTQSAEREAHPSPVLSIKPRTSVIIVTYNSASTIRECVESVLERSGLSTEVIIIDNASTDATRPLLAEFQGRITLILNQVNRGFACGCNQGIRLSAGDYVVLLNPDTVVTSGWLDRMVAHFGPDVGAVGPVSDYVAGLQKVSLYLPEQRSAGWGLAEAADSLARLNAGKAVQTKLLIGFCMVLPRKVLDEVGLLDEELFLGNDDLELSWRLHQRGYKLLVATDTFVHHEGQVSFKSEPSAKTSGLVQESTDRLYAKLETHYGQGNVPDPLELWGIDWFRPTAAHFRSKMPAVEQGLTSIIILTHNGLEHTEKCLTGIAAHTREPHELIIVDNGSTDGTLDHLRSYMASHANVRVIANVANRGFAAGNNQGLALARGEYVLLLNNDTIVTPGWLGRMLAVFQRHAEVGVVGPMSNYVSGPQLVRGASYTTSEELERFAAQWAAEHAEQSAPIIRVVGFCLLARKQVIERIGGLDEQFGSGNFEDDDLCIRAAQVGYAARIAQEVFIHHTGSQTFRSARIDYGQSIRRNWELFKRKWGIPADTPMEKGYRLPLQLSDGSRSYIPLPEVSADHQPQFEGRWWQEVSKAGEAAQRASSAAEPLSAVIVRNGHGLAPLWPSLVQHTNHPLAITILPSAGNGNGSDPVHQPACPEGWQVRIGDLPDVRLLNQLLESAHDDPVIVLSSNLVLTPGWLKRLLAALRRDQRLAAVGPTSNQGAATQRVKAEYKGTGKALRQFALRRAHRYGGKLAEVDSLAPFCLVFNRTACRPIGPLREDLDLAASLHDYFARLRQAGRIVAVALDAYVHCEQLARALECEVLS